MKPKSNASFTTQKKKSYSFGYNAESWASWMLRLKGYQIIDRRYKTPVGEIDLVARKGNMVAFIEVKARQDRNVYEVLTRHQQKRIMRAALYFIANRREFGTFNQRFDLMVVHSPIKIKHIANAW